MRQRVKVLEEERRGGGGRGEGQGRVVGGRGGGGGSRDRPGLLLGPSVRELLGATCEQECAGHCQGVCAAAEPAYQLLPIVMQKPPAAQQLQGGWVPLFQ